MTEVAGGIDLFPWSTKRIPANYPMSVRDLVGRELQVLGPGQARKKDLVPGRVTITHDENFIIQEIDVEPGEPHAVMSAAGG